MRREAMERAPQSGLDATLLMYTGESSNLLQFRQFTRSGSNRRSGNVHGAMVANLYSDQQAGPASQQAGPASSGLGSDGHAEVVDTCRNPESGQP